MDNQQETNRKKKFSVCTLVREPKLNTFSEGSSETRRGEWTIPLQGSCLLIYSPTFTCK